RRHAAPFSAAPSRAGGNGAGPHARRCVTPDAAAAALQAEKRLRGAMPPVECCAAVGSAAAHYGGGAVRSARGPPGRRAGGAAPHRAGPDGGGGGLGSAIPVGKTAVWCRDTCVASPASMPIVRGLRTGREIQTMSGTQFDVVAIGNAIVDIIGRCDD